MRVSFLGVLFHQLYLINILANAVESNLLEKINVFGFMIGVLCLFLVIVQSYKLKFQNRSQLFVFLLMALLPFISLVVAYASVPLFYIENMYLVSALLFLAQLIIGLMVFNSGADSARQFMRTCEIYALLIIAEYILLLLINLRFGTNYGFNTDHIYEGVLLNFEVTAFLVISLLVINTKRLIQRITVGRLMLTGTSIAVLLSMTRSYALTALFTVVFVYVSCMVIRTKKRTDTKYIGAAILILVSIPLGFNAFINQAGIRNIEYNSMDTILARILYGIAYSEMLVQMPLGVGPSNSRKIFLNRDVFRVQYDDNRLLNDLLPDNARMMDARLSWLRRQNVTMGTHNSVLTFMIEFGILGIFLMLYFFRKMLHYMYSKRSLKDSFVFSCCILLSCSVFSSLFLDLERIRVFWIILIAIIIRHIPSKIKFNERLHNSSLVNSNSIA